LEVDSLYAHISLLEVSKLEVCLDLVRSGGVKAPSGDFFLDPVLTIEVLQKVELIVTLETRNANAPGFLTKDLDPLVSIVGKE